MKVVVIEPSDQVEIVGVGADGSYILEDCQYWLDLEPGDLVQIMSDEKPGTDCFVVVETKPGDPGVYPRGLNLVTIRRPYLS